MLGFKKNRFEEHTVPFSGDTELFKENTFCNFEYLLAMTDADNIQKVMYNLDLAKSFLVDEDMHLLDLTLRSGGVAIHTSPLQLANELIGRMRQIKGNKCLRPYTFGFF